MEKINGIAVYDTGPREATSLIFVHGFPFNHDMWEPQTAVFSKTHRVITYDVRGHGQSDVGDGQYSLEFFVDDLFMVLDHLKIGRAVLCGLSMGGYIALRAAEREATRFSGLVLCDTKSEADGNEAKIKRAAAVRAVKKDGSGAFAESFSKSVLTENTLKSKPALVENISNMIRKNSPMGIAGSLLALAARTDTTAALAKMSLPALVLVGAEDKLTPPAASDVMTKALPQATMHVIPEAAHLSNLENPIVFNEKLTQFLKQF